MEHGRQQNLSHQEQLNVSKEQTVELFTQMSKRVQLTAASLSIFFGSAIGISLIALLMFSNGLGHYTWTLFFSAISLMVAATYSFHRFWSEQHQFTGVMDTQYSIIIDLKLKMDSENETSHSINP